MQMMNKMEMARTGGNSDKHDAKAQETVLDDAKEW